MANLLVVEDDVAVLEQMVAPLRKAGHQVATARDGSEVLQMLGVDGPATGVKPDLIVMDVMLLSVNAYMVLSKTKDHPESKDIPTVLVTGYTDLRDVFSKFKCVKAFVEKPADNRTIFNAIADVLSLQRAKAQQAAETAPA